MNWLKLNKDQIQKVALSAMGFVFLLYVYFSFFLGPLNRSRNNMLATMKDKQKQLDASKNDISKTATLEAQAKTATSRFAALKALNAEGAPIAWFPPKIKTFFANQQIDKATARLENTSGFKQPELSNWVKHTWLINLAQSDYVTFGKAIAELENAEPLLSITKVSIHAVAEQPQFQQIDLIATNLIEKK
jgi:hypothetical protein